MAFENLSEQISESLQTLKSRVMESESFNRVSEAYQNLPSRQQKLVAGLGLFLAVAVLVNIPLQSYLASHEEMVSYHEQKLVVADLKNTEKLRMQNSFTPEKFAISSLQSELLAKFNSLQITEAQFKIREAAPETFGIPKKAVTLGFQVELQNLNVRQVAKAANIIENLADSILVTSLRTTASSTDPHYFNTEFSILNFSIREDSDGGAFGAPGGRR